MYLRPVRMTCEETKATAKRDSYEAVCPLLHLGRARKQTP